MATPFRARSNRPGSFRTWATFGALLLSLAYAALERGSEPSPDAIASGNDTRIERLYQEQRSGEMVEGHGTVERILSDDNDGSRHQRFILRIDAARTVLVSHNIDLAPRVVDLESGDQISFRGQYEWNDQGGILHWTHHDPNGRRPGGWLQHEGETYR